MKIVIAPDSFKGSLSALAVGRAIKKGFCRVWPAAEYVIVPMADGGEGTVQSLLDARGGRLVRRRVTGPHGGKVTARYGLLAGNSTAIIEMAQASGLPLLKTSRLDPLKATTFGTGELLVDAIERGVNRIVVGIGGSATVDGGAGMAQALGYRLLDRHGRVIRRRGAGGMLREVVRIDSSQRHPGLSKVRVTVACDVDNPLYGRRGAAYVFGPQKGATPAAVRLLDGNLRHWGKILQAELGADFARMPGAGAAGGLGAGLIAFAGASLVSGVDLIIDAVGLKDHLQDATLVVTGEGRIDSQTPRGKTPAGVAQLAGRRRIPVIAIGGGLADDARCVYAMGIQGLSSAVARAMTIDEALAGAQHYLAEAAERAARLIDVGDKIAARRRRKRR